ncbi:MAG TPA: metal-dependent hydrolase [Kofleriaceae bacterium]|nr:metal-dependent hydrolase [Kofleriaceae bacterium]
MNPIVPRDLDVDFGAVPRHWLARNATATAIANGVNLLFPHGERFFVRSVKHFLDQAVDEPRDAKVGPLSIDPTLRAAIKGFFGQEGRHARAHDQFNQILRAQGYEIDRFLAHYHRLSSWLEAHNPPRLNLAITAAAEHFTAILAEGAFTENVLDAAAPEMRQLLAWHAAEELEHKAVAFDVLRRVDPSYALRIAGLLYATATLGGFWLWAAISLLRQERRDARGAWRDLGKMPRRDPIVARVFLRGIWRYLAPGFHPNNRPTDRIASEWMAARGMSLPGSTSSEAA